MDIDDDVLSAARSLAAAQGRSIGSVLSALARRGLRFSAETGTGQGGFPVFARVTWPDHVLHGPAQRWFGPPGGRRSPAVAAHHGGRLATLDRGVAQALHPDDRALVTLVSPT